MILYRINYQIRYGKRAIKAVIEMDKAMSNNNLWWARGSKQFQHVFCSQLFGGGTA